jgi:RNA polymerase sigma-70 factor (ECF subfamily)
LAHRPADEPSRFGAALIAALAPPLADLATSAAYAERLRAAFVLARDAAPALPAELLGNYVAARLSTAADLETALEPNLLHELFLACACTRGDASAIGRLEASYFPSLAAALGCMRLGPAGVDEVLQRLRAHLFLPRRDSEMGIASFRGRGALVSWLRVSAVRIACKLIDEGQKQRSNGDEQLARLASVGSDLESHYVKAWTRDAFKRAFAEAVGELSPRDKTLLRLHYVDGMSLDGIGVSYRTHRATAARWLAAARQQLLDRTRARLVAEHRIPLAECDSIIRGAQSRLELTFHRLFAASPEA